MDNLIFDLSDNTHWREIIYKKPEKKAKVKKISRDVYLAYKMAKRSKNGKIT